MNATTGAWECKRCHASGKLKEYWVERERPILPGRKQRNSALGAFSLQPVVEPQLNPNQVVQALASIEGAVGLHGTLGEAYLASRGIPAKVAALACVLFHPGWRFHRDRETQPGVLVPVGQPRPAVIFPKRGEGGQLVAVIGRYIDGGEPKSKTFGDLDMGVFLTPGALDTDPAIIVEGPMCALTLGLLDIPAIALGGTTTPAWLPRKLSGRRVVVATDADAAGEEAANRLSVRFSQAGCKVYRLRPCGDHGEKDFNDLLQSLGLQGLRREVGQWVSGLGVRVGGLDPDGWIDPDVDEWDVPPEPSVFVNKSVPEPCVCLFCKDALALPGRYECAGCALAQGLVLTPEELTSVRMAVA